MLSNMIKLFFFKRKFRKQNRNNMTWADNMFNLNHIEIGRKTYGGIAINDFSSENNKVIIGSYCSIGPQVYFILGGEHNLETLTTYPLKVKVLNEKKEAFSKGNIIIEDDVWIGAEAIINSGVHIGQGAVIASGAVVTKDIPAYAIVAGVPAKILKYRFSNGIIERLKKINLVELLDKCTNKNIDLFYQNLTELNLDSVISEIEKY